MSSPAEGTAVPLAKRPAVIAWPVGLAVLAADQATKVWAETSLNPDEPMRVVGSLLKFRLLYNPGAAFSVGTGSTWIFTLLATIVVAAVLVATWRRDGLKVVGEPLSSARSTWWIAGLLWGGAAGNLVDRLFRHPGFPGGHVVDFIQLPNFPVFNVADISITCAGAMLVLMSFLGSRTPQPTSAEDGSNNE